MTDPAVKTIADAARDSLGPYCMSVCKALCCRKGKILLQNKHEVDVVDGADRAEPLPSGMYALDVSAGCKKLTDSRCTIYADRPLACRDFPLFIVGGFAITASMCPAVQEGKLDSYLAQLDGLGVKRI